MSNKLTGKMAPGLRYVEIVDAFVSAPTTSASLYDAENMVNEEFHGAPGGLQREPIDRHARHATLELQTVFAFMIVDTAPRCGIPGVERGPRRAVLSRAAGMVVQ